MSTDARTPFPQPPLASPSLIKLCPPSPPCEDIISLEDQEQSSEGHRGEVTVSAGPVRPPWSGLSGRGRGRCHQRSSSSAGRPGRNCSLTARPLGPVVPFCVCSGPHGGGVGDGERNDTQGRRGRQKGVRKSLFLRGEDGGDLPALTSPRNLPETVLPVPCCLCDVPDGPAVAAARLTYMGGPRQQRLWFGSRSYVSGPRPAWMGASPRGANGHRQASVKLSWTWRGCAGGDRGRLGDKCPPTHSPSFPLGEGSSAVRASGVRSPAYLDSLLMTLMRAPFSSFSLWLSDFSSVNTCSGTGEGVSGLTRPARPAQGAAPPETAYGGGCHHPSPSEMSSHLMLGFKELTAHRFFGHLTSWCTGFMPHTAHPPTTVTSTLEKLGTVPR